MIIFRIKIENHFSELEEATFFSSQLFNSFQRITSQNQARITTPDSVAFDTASLILSENQELGVVPNGALVYHL
jgi:hypothetical protein